MEGSSKHDRPIASASDRLAVIRFVISYLRESVQQHDSSLESSNRNVNVIRDMFRELVEDNQLSVLWLLLSDLEKTISRAVVHAEPSNRVNSWGDYKEYLEFYTDDSENELVVEKTHSSPYRNKSSIKNEPERKGASALTVSVARVPVAPAMPAVPAVAAASRIRCSGIDIPFSSIHDHISIFTRYISRSTLGEKEFFENTFGNKRGSHEVREAVFGAGYYMEKEVEGKIGDNHYSGRIDMIFNGCIYEFKATSRTTPQHLMQLIAYMVINNCYHGKLINSKEGWIYTIRILSMESIVDVFCSHRRTSRAP